MKPLRCTTCDTSGRLHGHHNDYEKPDDLEYLCPRCHRAAHASGVDQRGIWEWPDAAIVEAIESWRLCHGLTVAMAERAMLVLPGQFAWVRRSKTIRKRAVRQRLCQMLRRVPLKSLANEGSE